jgi:hypothetical protein
VSASRTIIEEGWSVICSLVPLIDAKLRGQLVVVSLRLRKQLTAAPPSTRTAGPGEKVRSLTSSLTASLDLAERDPAVSAPALPAPPPSTLLVLARQRWVLGLGATPHRTLTTHATSPARLRTLSRPGRRRAGRAKPLRGQPAVNYRTSWLLLRPKTFQSHRRALPELVCAYAGWAVQPAPALQAALHLMMG